MDCESLAAIVAVGEVAFAESRVKVHALLMTDICSVLSLMIIRGHVALAVLPDCQCAAA